MMLQESDDRIVDFLQRMTLKRRLSDHQIQDSMASGKSWPKCWGKHQSARVQLGERLGRKDSCLVHDNWIHVDTVNAGLHCVTICDVVPHVLSVSFFLWFSTLDHPRFPLPSGYFAHIQMHGASICHPASKICYIFTSGCVSA